MSGALIGLSVNTYWKRPLDHWTNSQILTTASQPERQKNLGDFETTDMTLDFFKFKQTFEG